MTAVSAALLLVGLVTAGPLAAQPYLVVRINGQVINTNHEHLFPDTLFGESSQVVVVLRNEGNQTLEFTENPPIMMAGGFPDSFELVQPALEPGNVLSPNGSTAFAVRFEPEFATSISLFSHVYIWTNASATPFHMVVRGSVLSPQMVVKLASDAIPDLGAAVFDNTRVGETGELVFTIENQGTGALELTENPPVFLAGGLGEFVMQVTQQPDGVIAAGGSSEFRVQFTPTEERKYITRLFIYVNENSAAVNALYDIDLEGSGTIVDCNVNGVDDAEDVATGASDDCNGNGLPDECESDMDGDGVIDACDICPDAPNPDQADSDGDGLGDACDSVDDSANGGVGNDIDNGPAEEEAQQDQLPMDDEQAGADLQNEQIDEIDELSDNLFGPPLCGAGLFGLLPATLFGLAGMKSSYRRQARV